MKRLILILFCSITTFINAQTYKPIVDDYNEWHFTTCFGGCLTDVYFTDGDTNYVGFDYKILNGFHFISRTFWLREDSLNQKVYLSYDAVGTRKEDLLYDFSIQVGDSIEMKNPISPFLHNAGFYTVDSIIMDQLQDANFYRHFYLSPSISNSVSSNNAEWIEGVGSLSLINSPSGRPDINDVGELSCFFKNSILFYSNLDSISNCAPTIVSSSDEKTIDKIKLYPTIVENECHITGIEFMKDINIYNIHGKKIKQISIHNKTHISFSLENLQSGLYFVILTDTQQNKSSFKIIKK
ncbi:MAG: T9SS type A sorting domain-containing protein [Flavobacteriales bacterium]|nr:T9SS type A sorting domain-containing protein [Flavobacteriales bacterium]